MKVEIGYQYDTYGTVEATDQGFRYTGAEATLERIITRLRLVYPKLTPEQLVASLEHTMNNGYFWAHPVKEAAPAETIDLAERLADVQTQVERLRREGSQ